MEEDGLFYGSTAAMPARHFPAFAACGRTGGGFRLEGRYSNAAYNRHIANLKPRPHSAASSCNIGSNSRQSRSLSPERLNTTSYHSQKKAAAVGHSISMATGTWSHVLDMRSNSTAADNDTGSMPCGPAAEVATQAPQCMHNQQMLFQGTAAATTGAEPHHLNGDACQLMPTTFCISEALQHSLWLHDGTDFTRGHMEQVLPKRPCSAGPLSTRKYVHRAPRHENCSSGSSSNSGSSNSSQGGMRTHSACTSHLHRPSSRLMQHPQQGWKANHHRPVLGDMSEEIEALMRHTSRTADSTTWFSCTPVQVLKIEREKQRATEQAWLTQFHPTEGAKSPNRSASLHTVQIGYHDDHEQQFKVDTVIHTKPLECDASGCFVNSNAMCNTNSHRKWQQQQQLGAEGYASPYQLRQAASAAVGMEQQQQQPADSSSEEEEEEEEVWDELEGAGDIKHPQLSDVDVREIVADSAAECAAARAAAAAAAAERNTPKPPWWAADVRLAQKVNMLLQPGNSAATKVGKISRGEYSATLGVYESMLATNTEKAVQLQQGGHLGSRALVQQLLTPEHMHAAWVSELSRRPMAARQRQILVEAAVATAAVSNA